MSMYKIYIDDMLLPMGTDKLETTISDRDDEMELINGEVISVIKAPGLTTWKFTTLISPHYIYGGCYEEGKTVVVDDLLSKLEKLKLNKTPFNFVVIRTDNLGETSTMVTLQDYKRTESTDNALLSEVEIKLRQYKSHENTSIEIELPEKPPIEDDTYLEYKGEITRLENMNPPETYVVRPGVGTNSITPPGMPGVPGVPIAYAKLPSWFDIGKELFGDTKYGYGIRNTNNLHWNKGELEDLYGDPMFPTTRFPGNLYPNPYDTLKIDVPNIVVQTNLVMQSPANLR